MKKEAAVRNSLTTLILHTTSFSYRKKEALKTAHALKAVWLVIVILASELFLNIISIPIYVSVRGAGTDGKDPAVATYKTRRFMTLSVIATLAILWVIKLAFIIYLSFASATGHYSVKVIPSGTKPIPQITVDLPKTTLDATLPIPVITRETSDSGEVSVSGTAIPNGTVITTIEDVATPDDDPRLYSDTADASGKFSTTEDARTFWLPDGDYRAHATLYDKAHGMRSNESNTVMFTVAPDLATRLFTLIDPIINILMIVLIIIGLLATVLTV